VRGEDQLQANVCKYLHSALPSTAWFTAIPNGTVLAGDSKARAIQSNKLKATGMRPGAPDLHICWEGRAIYIELKAPKGKLADTQITTSNQIALAGGLWTVARSVEDVAGFLGMCGVPLKARLT